MDNGTGSDPTTNVRNFSPDDIRANVTSPTLERASREPVMSHGMDCMPDAEALQILQDIAHDMKGEGWDRTARWVEWAARQLAHQRDMKLAHYGAREEALKAAEALQERCDALEAECEALEVQRQNHEASARGLRASLEIVGQERDEHLAALLRASVELERLRVDCNVKTDALNAEVRAHGWAKRELMHLRGMPRPAVEPMPERRPGETGDLCSICRSYHGPERLHHAE